MLCNPSRVRTVVYNIDSLSRDDVDSYTSTNFVYTFMNPLKNIASLKMSSIEIPNTSYVFTNDTKFIVQDMQGRGVVINVPIGNWTTGNFEIKLNSMFEQSNELRNTLGLNLQIVVDAQEYKVTIFETTPASSNGPKPFKLVFADVYNENGDNVYNTNFGFTKKNKKKWFTSFGYLIGYRQEVYEGQNVYNTEAGPDFTGSDYLFLQVNEYCVVHQQTPDNDFFHALAKVVISGEKNFIAYDDSSNQLTKEIKFPQPITLSKLNVKLVNEYGEVIDLIGHDFSFTLEMTQIMSSEVYEKYRKQGIPFISS